MFKKWNYSKLDSSGKNVEVVEEQKKENDKSSLNSGNNNFLLKNNYGSVTKEPVSGGEKKEPEVDETTCTMC